jgi:hypothetical protein
MVRRVLPTEGSLKVEVSFQTAGKILGVDHRSMATYTASIRPDGSAYGEGQGIVTGKNGERATWKGQGVGKLLADGSVSYRGAVYYEIQSEKWKRLNTVALAFEYEVDAEGTTRTKFWEWK